MTRTQQVRRFLATRYASADPRSLGLFRIALGTLLFVDVASRLGDVRDHYSNAGWLPNHALLFRPLSAHQFSLYLPFSTPAEVTGLMLVHLLVNALLIVGFRTRLMQVLAALLITSLNSRNVLLENGGFVAVNLLAVWSVFLPLGRTLSVDSVLAQRRGQPAPDDRPVVSLAVAAILLQWVVIYYFNTIHKSGQTWRDGTAVYYFFQEDRMVTQLGAHLRQTLPLSAIRVLTYATLVTEGTICALLIAPFRIHTTRMIAWVLVIVLHLSIALVMDLGPFSWVMMTAFFIFIPPSFWQRPRVAQGLSRVREWLVGTGVEAKPPEEPSPAQVAWRRITSGARELAVLLLMVCLGSQVLIENRAVPRWLVPASRPEWMTAVVVLPRLFQGWAMFAPNPPNHDGKIVVVARTADGRTIDPLTGAAPDFDVAPARGFGMTAAWGDFHSRIAEPRFAHLLPHVIGYLQRYPERTGRPEDRLTQVEIWYVDETIPPPGQPRLPPERRKLRGSVLKLPGLFGGS